MPLFQPVLTSLTFCDPARPVGSMLSSCSSIYACVRACVRADAFSGRRRLVVLFFGAFYIRNETLVAVDLLTRLRLHCHISTISMQLGQPQPGFSIRSLAPVESG